jgi:hypothetical protein
MKGCVAITGRREDKHTIKAPVFHVFMSKKDGCIGLAVHTRHEGYQDKRESATHPDPCASINAARKHAFFL